MPSSHASRPGGQVCRRALLLGSLGVAGWPVPADAADPGMERFAPPAADDMLVFGDAGRSGRVVAPDDVRAGAPPLRAWPMQPGSGVIRNGTRFNQVLLVRLLAGGGGGLAAFSAICTHASCAVSGWDAALRLLVCPCHGSAYAADHGGAVVRGPAPRRLPALPLKNADNMLRVASAFDSRVGGDTGRTM